MPTLRIALLRLAKLAGLFRVAEMTTAGWLRIVCYHGASWSDEHRFRPTLFMSPDSFRRRMNWLKSRNFRVLPLEDALRLLDTGRLPPRAAVITIDDGWSGTFRHMLPVLRERGFPATLYVATRPLARGGLVAHVLVDYLLWRARDREFDLAVVDERLSGHNTPRTPEDRERLAATINGALRKKATHHERLGLISRLAVKLGQQSQVANFPSLARLMTPDELAASRHYGVDVQLHSHTHRMPIGKAERLRREIRANRAALGPCAASALNHFCYPSGVHDPSALAVLSELGIKSATTCEPGMADASTPRLLLPRFLDADDIPQIVFEAEMSGLLEIARRCRQLLRGRRTEVPRSPAGGTSTPAA